MSIHYFLLQEFKIYFKTKRKYKYYTYNYDNWPHNNIPFVHCTVKQCCKVVLFGTKDTTSFCIYLCDCGMLAFIYWHETIYKFYKDMYICIEEMHTCLPNLQTVCMRVLHNVTISNVQLDISIVWRRDFLTWSVLLMCLTVLLVPVFFSPLWCCLHFLVFW